MPEEAARAAYERYAAPATARVLFQNAFGPLAPHSAARLHAGNPDRAPLLLVSGGADRTTPPKMNKANLRKYQKSSAVTDYHEFPARGHLTMIQDGWEDVADHVERWARSAAETAPSKQ